jgi:hypothetical protein
MFSHSKKDLCIVSTIKLLQEWREAECLPAKKTKKHNVKCVWYYIDVESHVLLVACSGSACGKKLYYDYKS